VTPEQKRQAVEMALMPFLHGQTLAQALVLWDEKYSHKPTFALQHYLRELCSDIELAHMRSRMLQALVAAFSSQQDNRQQHKTAQPTPPATVATVKKNHSSPELQMFMTLVDQLINSAQGDIATRVRLYTLENVEKLALPANDRRALQTWLNQIEPLTGTTPTINTMQQVINFVYVGLCEYLGPIKADQFLQHSVSATQRAYPMLKVQSLL
jgi:hypothetical protein